MPNDDPGQTAAYYRIQGVEAATGSVTIIASAPGFTDGTGTATVVPPALYISGLSTGTTSLSPDDPFVVYVGIPNSTNTALAQTQAVRPGGVALTATITNSDGTVGQLVTTATTGQSVTVGIPVGQASSPSSVAAGGVAFDPLGGGSTTVAATIPGLIATDGASRNVTVTVSP